IAAADGARKWWIGAQSLLCFYDGPDCGTDTFGITFNLSFGRGESGEREMANVGWIISAPHIDQNFSDSPSHRRFASHSVAPKAIDLSLLQRMGGAHPEGDVACLCARQFHDPEVSVQIDIGIDKHSTEREVRPLVCRYTQSLYRA